jgi:hypothetical protein
MPDAGQNPYSRPRAENQGRFDSFDDDHFFQMTISDSKEVKVQYIEKNLKQCQLALPGQSQDKVNLVIVVPDDVFPAFTKLSFKYNADKGEVDATKPGGDESEDKDDEQGADMGAGNEGPEDAQDGDGESVGHDVYACNNEQEDSGKASPVITVKGGKEKAGKPPEPPSSAPPAFKRKRESSTPAVAASVQSSSLLSRNKAPKEQVPAWATSIQQYLLPIPTEATIVSALRETPELAERKETKSKEQAEVPNNTGCAG